MNDAAVYVHIQVFMCTYFQFFGYVPRSGIADSMLTLCLIFRGTDKLFAKAFHAPLYIPTSNVCVCKKQRSKGKRLCHLSQGSSQCCRASMWEEREGTASPVSYTRTERGLSFTPFPGAAATLLQCPSKLTLLQELTSNTPSSSQLTKEILAVNDKPERSSYPSLLESSVPQLCREHLLFRN